MIFSLFTDNLKVELGLQDLSWLLSNLEDVASDWFNFGLKLNIKYGHLKVIEANNRNDVVACLREVLACWLNQNPTAGQLLKALKEMEKNRLLQHIKQGLSQGDHRRG